MSGIPSWAVKGAKVVCIDDNWDKSAYRDPDGLMQFPQQGPIYTVREVRVRYVTEYGGQVLIGVVLQEVSNPVAVGGSSTGEEPGWDIGCFRPLVSRAAEDDVAIFRPILDQVPEDA